MLQTHPEIKPTINMEHIKVMLYVSVAFTFAFKSAGADAIPITGHYYTSHININPHQIVPLWNGPNLDVPYSETVNAAKL